jgi:hypothetical protein
VKEFDLATHTAYVGVLRCEKQNPGPMAGCVKTKRVR